MNSQEVDALLVAAIQDGQLQTVVGELLGDDALTSEGRTRVEEAAAALSGLDELVESERARLIAALETSGVRAEADPNPARDRPLHRIVLKVERQDVDAAVAAIEAASYRRLAPTSNSQWRAFRETQGRCNFVRTDREPFRIMLTWPVRTSRITTLLRPHESDFEVVDLPEKLWPLYSVIHLARLPLRLARRRNEPADLGPFHQTPDALVDPLLHFADLQPDELLVDLGSGDCRIPIAAAERFGCRARGVDYDPALVRLAKRAIAESPAGDRVEAVLGDAATAPLDDANVVVVFLPVDTLQSLIPDILAQLRPGARLVVHEQERLDVEPPADVQAPLLAAGGVTVMHRWNR